MTLNPKRTAFIEKARSYVDTRFRHQGRNLKSGIDCVGVIVCAAMEVLGWKGGPTGYPKKPTGEIAFKLASQYAKRITAAEAMPGDIVLMMSGDEPTHFGILTEKGGLIHGTNQARRVVEQPITEDMRASFKAYWRLNGID